MKNISLYGVVILSVILMCNSSNFRKQFEGIERENFRVYVRIEIMDISENISDEEINRILFDKGKQRFSDLMNGFIVTNKKNEDIVKKAIASQSNPKVYNRKDKETYIEAFIDFKIDQQLIDLYRSEYPEIKKETDKDE